LITNEGRLNKKSVLHFEKLENVPGNREKTQTKQNCSQLSIVGNMAESGCT
jgi:hypothetical protein